jgi:hypothetical protein
MTKLMVSVMFVIACGKGGSTSNTGGSAASGASGGSTAAAPALGGTWKGTWQRAAPASGGGELVLTMGANPTFKRIGTLCPPEETPATVTVTGDKVTIEVATPDVKATYAGVRSGNDITGELVTTCKLGTGNGTWKLTMQ